MLEMPNIDCHFIRYRPSAFRIRGVKEILGKLRGVEKKKA